MRTVAFLPLLLSASRPAAASLPDPVSVDPVSWQQQIEADWLRAELLLAAGKERAVSAPADDAAGGCDGIKDGGYGFHTGHAESPWWHVDLGQPHSIDRVVIWNRCETPDRAANLLLLLSDDGQVWDAVYQHDGSTFLGVADQKPLVIPLVGAMARFVRVQLPGSGYLHLDEVEVFGPADPAANLALRRPADQVSVSQWSRDHRPPPPPDWPARTEAVLATGARLAAELAAAGIPVAAEHDEIARLRDSRFAANVASGPDAAPALPGAYRDARRLLRRLALRSPLLDFEALLFTKRVPPSFNHMSDQYYGWWSKPGGGICLLRGFRGDAPSEQCLTAQFEAPGSFLRPALSYDAQRVLFAWCRHYPDLAAHPDKLNKANVPEDAFYHLFEMRVDGTALRQLTRGKYDDFDGRYLPDGRIVFLSTRRGQALRVGRDTARRTLVEPDLPDCYVRCGGGPERPVAVYTLHTISADGADICAISPFEMFEWTPEPARDGSILYSRWDYIDRDNMPYMGLWAMNPDGTNARIVYGNFTRSPHCAFEPKPVPASRKIVFTASAHHAQTMGSLVLLDPAAGTEGERPITRLTPEVPFPEAEGWPLTSYANPWPLSERFHLVAWGCEGALVPGPGGWDRWHAVQRPPNGMALYLYDAATGSRELLMADPQFTCGDPIPLRPRERPPVVAAQLAQDAPPEGRFLVSDVYRGLTTVARGQIRALRIVAVPPKTHPTMNFPNMGLTLDDPGKCVLGTVPVEADGSAYFCAPAGVIVFFQALDARGMAVQTMRSATHVQPGQTLGCIGCHEPRHDAAPLARPLLATRRAPSSITPGPDGSWPLRFDRLVQPVLDRHCVSCHRPDAPAPEAARLDLTVPSAAYDALVAFGQPSLREQVSTAYRRGASIEGIDLAASSALLNWLRGPAHEHLALAEEDWERLVTWIDTYAQRLGSFSPEQELTLEEMRRHSAAILAARAADTGR